VFQKGDSIVSCDSLGVVKLWDVRKVAITETLDFGPYSLNSVTFSPLSTMVVAASDDGSIKSYNLVTQQLTPLTGHEDIVNCVKYDLNGSYLLSGGCDNSLRIWS
jgi:sperm-associated antigen 16 protein